MSWRIAAVWALLGFAGQCFLAVLKGLDMVEGFERAIVHYLAWGVAGFVVGWAVQRSVEEIFRIRFAKADSENVVASPTSIKSSTG